MSHWKKGKLKMKCSLSVLQRALEKIMPQWTGKIQISEAGKLEAINSYDGSKEQGYNLIVPGGARFGREGGLPDLPYADLGFERIADGTWSFDLDETFFKYGVDKLKAELLHDIPRVTLQDAIEANGWLVEGSLDGDEIELIVDPGYETAL